MMHLTVTKKLGDNEFNFTFLGETLHDCIMESQHLGFPDVHQCEVCTRRNLRFSAYITEKDKYKYVKIVCGNCRAQATLGVAKKDGAYFLRRNDKGAVVWEKYEEPRSSAGRQDEVPF